MQTAYRSSHTGVTETPGGWMITQSFSVLHPHREKALELAQHIKKFVEDLDEKLNPRTKL